MDCLELFQRPVQIQNTIAGHQMPAGVAVNKMDVSQILRADHIKEGGEGIHRRRGDDIRIRQTRKARAVDRAQQTAQLACFIADVGGVLGKRLYRQRHALLLCLAGNASHCLCTPAKRVLCIHIQIGKAGGYHHVVAVQLHGRFDVLVEKVHGAVPIDLIRMRNADGIHALLRRKAAQSKMMCLDLAVQLSQTGSVEILQMEVGAGCPQFDRLIAQPLGRFQKIIQRIALVMIICCTQL